MLDLESNSTWINLFGNASDKRVVMFLNELYEQSLINKKKRKGTDFEIQDFRLNMKSIIFQNQVFTIPDGGKKDDAVHSEWINFFKDILIFYKSPPSAPVKVIYELAVTPDSPSDVKFINALCKFLVINTKPNISWDQENFNSIYMPLGIDKITTTESTPSTSKIFNINKTKMFVKSFLGESLQKAETLSAFDVKSKNRSTPVYYRNEDGMLCIMTEDGKEQLVDSRSTEFKALVEKSIEKDTGFGFKACHEDEQCSKYILDCLSGNGIERCSAFLQSSNYWEKAKEEVADMSPEIARGFLRKLEFEKVDSTITQMDGVTRRIKIKEMESVESWVSKLKDKLDEKSARSIASNEKLLGYLRLVVDKINNSPTILNPSIDNKGVLIRRQYNDDTLLGRIGLQHKPSVLHNYAPDMDNNFIRDYYLRSPVNVKENSRKVVISGVQGSSPIRLNIQSGGAVNPNDPKQYYIDEEDEMKLARVSDMFTSRFRIIEKQLAAKGKSISGADRDKIVELIESLRKSETVLWKFIIYTNAFIKLMASGDDDGDEVINFENLKTLVDNRTATHNKASGKSLALINILDTLVLAINAK